MKSPTGRTRWRSTAFDLLILDVMLTGLDRVALCRAIRADGPNSATPILMLTARDGESDKVLGLESGADDYVTKPFGVRELVARVAAIMRRSQRTSDHDLSRAHRIMSRDIVLDLETRAASVRGQPIELTKQEFDLLATECVE